MRNIKEIGGNKGKMVSVFKESMKICRDGEYEVNGNKIKIGEDLKNSIDGTDLYDERFFEWGINLEEYRREVGKLEIEVTKESTVECGRRLWELGSREYCVLNFASGVSVGGGVLMGAVAQEEDLCRSSGLYLCLDQGHVEEYYMKNRETKVRIPYYPESVSGVYTDNMIYSPLVPFFRDGELNLIDNPFLMSIVTSPAPCVRDMDMEDEGLRKFIRKHFFLRMERVLSLMAFNGHREIILGAWGCGAFGNRALDVARMFRIVLEESYFAGLFDRVIFAIKADSDLDENYVAFKREFDGI